MKLDKKTGNSTHCRAFHKKWRYFHSTQNATFSQTNYYIKWAYPILSACDGWKAASANQTVLAHQEAIRKSCSPAENGETRQLHLSRLRLCLCLFSGSFIWTPDTGALTALDSAQRDLGPKAFLKRNDKPKVASWKSIHQSEWISSSTAVDREDKIEKNIIVTLNWGQFRESSTSKHLTSTRQGSLATGISHNALFRWRYEMMFYG